MPTLSSRFAKGMIGVVDWRGLFPNREVGFTHAANPGGGRQGLIRIELEVFASNAPAIALFQGAGFAREGVKRKARYLDGVFSEIECMALIIEEPETSRRGQPLLVSPEANP